MIKAFSIGFNVIVNDCSCLKSHFGLLIIDFLITKDKTPLVSGEKVRDIAYLAAFVSAIPIIFTGSKIPTFTIGNQCFGGICVS